MRAITLKLCIGIFAKHDYGHIWCVVKLAIRA